MLQRLSEKNIWFLTDCLIRWRQQSKAILFDIALAYGLGHALSRSQFTGRYLGSQWRYATLYITLPVDTGIFPWPILL